MPLYIINEEGNVLADVEQKCIILVSKLFLKDFTLERSVFDLGSLTKQFLIICSDHSFKEKKKGHLYFFNLAFENLNIFGCEASSERKSVF